MGNMALLLLRLKLEYTGTPESRPAQQYTLPNHAFATSRYLTDTVGTPEPRTLLRQRLSQLACRRMGQWLDLAAEGAQS